MNKTAINPWDWSLKFGFNQGEIIEGATRQLTISGQTSVDETGAPQHAGDMRAQMKLALQNLQDVISDADMTLADITQIRIYTTNIRETLDHYDLMGQTFATQNHNPPMSLIGVNALVMPELMFEIDAVAHA